MVQVLVNLLGLTVLAEHSAQDAETAHPQHLLRHAGVAGAAALAVARVPTLALGFKATRDAGTGMDLARLYDDEAILNQLTDVLAGVCHGDLIHLVWIQPHLPLA